MNLLNSQEIENFKKDGAIVLRNKFDISWIEKLKKGSAKGRTKERRAQEKINVEGKSIYFIS